jgi:hypothetical protein
VGAAVIAAHNLEEALFAPTWLPRHSAELGALLGKALPHVSQQRLHFALALVTLLSVAWVAAAFRSPPRSLGAYSLVTLFGIYIANAFVPHIFGAFVLGVYYPGLITAAFAVVPYTLLFVLTGLRDSRYTARGVAVALTVALALYACAGIMAWWTLAERLGAGA